MEPVPLQEPPSLPTSTLTQYSIDFSLVKMRRWLLLFVVLSVSTGAAALGQQHVAKFLSLAKGEALQNNAFSKFTNLVPSSLSTVIPPISSLTQWTSVAQMATVGAHMTVEIASLVKIVVDANEELASVERIVQEHREVLDSVRFEIRKIQRKIKQIERKSRSMVHVQDFVHFIVELQDLRKDQKLLSKMLEKLQFGNLQKMELLVGDLDSNLEKFGNLSKTFHDSSADSLALSKADMQKALTSVLTAISSSAIFPDSPFVPSSLYLSSVIFGAKAVRQHFSHRKHHELTDKFEYAQEFLIHFQEKFLQLESKILAVHREYRKASQFSIFWTAGTSFDQGSLNWLPIGRLTCLMYWMWLVRAEFIIPLLLSFMMCVGAIAYLYPKGSKSDFQVFKKSLKISFVLMLLIGFLNTFWGLQDSYYTETQAFLRSQAQKQLVYDQKCRELHREFKSPLNPVSYNDCQTLESELHQEFDFNSYLTGKFLKSTKIGKHLIDTMEMDFIKVFSLLVLIALLSFGYPFHAIIFACCVLMGLHIKLAYFELMDQFRNKTWHTLSIVIKYIKKIMY